MRRHHDRRVSNERTINGRLLFKNIERGACYLARLDRLQQGRLIHDPSPGAIDHPQSLLRPAQHIRTDERAGALGLCNVDGEEITAGCQVAKLIDKLSQQRRQEILLEVRESNLEAQLFFKAQDFRAVRVLRTHYDDTTEDAYVMRYRLYETAADTVSFQPQNRIDFYNDAA